MGLQLPDRRFKSGRHLNTKALVHKQYEGFCYYESDHDPIKKRLPYQSRTTVFRFLVSLLDVFPITHMEEADVFLELFGDLLEIFGL